MTDLAPAARVEILGDVTLRVGAAPIPLTTLERGLLARAALSTSVGAQSLQPWLWGEQPPQSARNRVQALVSGLRRKVTAPLLVTSGSSYQLDPEVETDIAHWQRLIDQARSLRRTDASASLRAYRTALEVFEGSPLRGITSTYAVETEREQLEQVRLGALEESVALAVDLGAAQGLDVTLQPLVAAHPFRETLIALYLRVLASTGQQEQALRTYRETYRRLDEELGVSPSRALREAHQEVLSGQASAPESVGSAPRTTSSLPVPRTLPRRPLDFVGRAAELQQILAAAERVDEAAVVVSITGLVGMGKSALAVVAGQRLRERFPGGTLYADASADRFSGGPHDILTTFLRLLGLAPEAIPVDPIAREAVFRSMIDARRVLIVLDNIDQASAPAWADVSGLLPGGAGSMAVLTSRLPLSGLGPTHALALHSLPEPDRLTLLAGLIGADRVAADPAGAAALVSATGGIPLSLRVVGARLATRPDTELAMAAQTVQAAGPGPAAEGTDALEAALRTVWHRLPGPARQVAALCAGVGLRTCSGWVPGALLGDAGGGEHAMDALIAASFVEPVVHKGRAAQYRWHEVVARLAWEQERLPDRDCQDARRRLGAALLTRCLDQARHTPAQFAPLPPAPGSLREENHARNEAPTAGQRVGAVRVFRTESATIRSLAWALRHEEPAIAWRLLAATASAHHDSDAQADWMTAAVAVRAALGEDPDGRAGAAALALPMAWNRQDHSSASQEALDLLASADDALADLGWSRHQAAAAVIAAHAHTALGCSDAAHSALARAEQLLAAAHDSVLTGQAAIARGILHNDYDEMDAAEREFAHARTLLATTPARGAHALAGLELSRALWRRQDLERAEPLIDEVLQALLDLEDDHLYSYALDARAEVSLQRLDGEHALAEASDAWARAEAARDAFLTARSRRTLGGALALLGRLEESETHLRASMAQCLAMHRPLSAAAAAHDLSLVLQARGQDEEAEAARATERELRASADLADRTGFAGSFGRARGQFSRGR